MKDISASVLARLKEKAKKTSVTYQQILQLFIQEEFLRRLSFSKERNRLILKGGLFVYTLTNFSSRATLDVDFLLNNYSNSLQSVKNLINEILNTSTGNDYIKMEARNFEVISPQRQYQGICSHIVGKIKNVQIAFHVDIGVGDVIVPRPEERKIRTQLQDFEMPIIMTYSLESTIAEKLDAILQRLQLTGRMKDFYDIYYLSRTFDFDGKTLQTAIDKTLQQRLTTYDKNSFKRIIDLIENDDVQRRWTYFIKSIKEETLGFADVIYMMQTFIEPVFDSIVNEVTWNKKWISNVGCWADNSE